jgi:anti-anti-sigma factor
MARRFGHLPEEGDDTSDRLSGRRDGYVQGVWHADAFARDGDQRAHPLTYDVDQPDPDDVVVHLHGELSQDPASRRVERVLEEHYVNNGVRRIHIDLEDLEAIDLEGVAVLLHLYRESRRRGKVLTVERAQGAVRRRLATTGVLRIMAPPEQLAG